MTYKQLLAIAFKKWTLENCIWIYDQGPIYYQPTGKPNITKKSTMHLSIAKYIAKKKFAYDMAAVKKSHTLNHNQRETVQQNHLH